MEAKYHKDFLMEEYTRDCIIYKYQFLYLFFENKARGGV